jgi:hypothetical protein
MFKIQKQYIPFTKQWEEIVLRPDSFGISRRSIARTIDKRLEFRPLSKDVIDHKDEWRIDINDIIDCHQILDIVFNEKNLDRINMNPLTNYIVIHKLWEHKEHNLSLNKKDYREWQSMEQYMKVFKAIFSDELNFQSNLDNNIQTKHKIIDTVKHAFGVNISIKLIREFIIRHTENDGTIANETGKWQCIVDYYFKIGAEYLVSHMKMISWNSVKYIYAFLPSKTNDICEDFKIYFCNRPNENQTECSQLILTPHNDNIKIIINEIIDQNITHAFIETLIEWAKTDNSGTLAGEEFGISYYTNQLIGVLIGDENAIIHVNKDKNILIYYEKHSFSECDISIKCIFAAIIGETRVAIYTFKNHIKDTSMQVTYRLKYEQLANHIIEMRYERANVTFLSYQNTA